MMDSKFYQDLSAKLRAVLPDNLSELPDNIQQQFHQVLQQGLGKLDVVSREEFDAQAQVLAKTRQKLDELAAKVSALENNADS